MADGVWVGAIHAEVTDHLPITIVETDTFVTTASELLDEDEVVGLKIRLAANPRAGTLIPQTGGVRITEYAGRSGAGVLVAYYFHSAKLPVVLLSCFTGKVDVELGVQEKSRMKALVKALVTTYMRKHLRIVK